VKKGKDTKTQNKDTSTERKTRSKKDTTKRAIVTPPSNFPEIDKETVVTLTHQGTCVPHTKEREMKKMNREVKQYIEKQKSPQKEIVKRLRKIILKTFPDLNEEMKLGVPWYEGKFYIVALKDSVNLGFSLKGLSKEEKELLEGDGKTMKHIKIQYLKEIDEKKIVKLLRMVGKK